MIQKRSRRPHKTTWWATGWKSIM